MDTKEVLTMQHHNGIIVPFDIGIFYVPIEIGIWTSETTGLINNLPLLITEHRKKFVVVHDYPKYLPWSKIDQNFIILLILEIQYKNSSLPVLFLRNTP